MIEETAARRFYRETCHFNCEGICRNEWLHKRVEVCSADSVCPRTKDFDSNNKKI